jgi:hypothetical protein
VNDYTRTVTREQFSSMVDIVDKFMPHDDSSSDDSNEDLEPKAPQLKGLDPKKLEIVANEFRMTF